jgi:hypothetical protein
VRCRGSQIFYTIGSQMAEILTALRAGRSPYAPQEDSWYSFLLEAESTPNQNINLANKFFQCVSKFRYLGTTLRSQNYIRK